MQGNNSFQMQVPAADGKMRFWRNTSIATLAAGATASLVPSSLGYEFDEDLDNGGRPAGLFRLSSTTVSVQQRILDYYANEIGPGVATHHMTEYRAPSGALVFGAGVALWSWGLDDENPNSNTPDVRMQQATVNLLADMGVQPKTLIAGLTAATKSTDTVGPTTTITAPAPNANVSNGSTVTISGTAVDSGGGTVAGVEVSTDGGTTWHPATGRGSWTYSWNVQGAGSLVIKARAVDDSGNIGSVASGPTVTVGCPCSIFATTMVPATPSANDGGSVELGLQFRSTMSGSITGLRFYKGAGNTGTHVGTLWTATGQKLASVTFTNETASGWQTANFGASIGVSANTSYVISYHTTTGHYAADPLYFQAFGTNDSPTNTQPLYAPRDGKFGATSVFAYSDATTFPNQSSSGTNYWVDPLFSTSAAADVTPPSVTATSPVPGATGVSVNAPVSATFSEPVQPASVVVALKNSGGQAVAGTMSYDAGSMTATVTPSAPLATGSTYSVSVSATDVAGNAMPAAYAWSFTTAGPRLCPCSIFSSDAPVGASTGSSAAIEVGVKFVADSSGYITGVRFYKPAGATGTHVGNLWSATGQKLASVTFTGETASGWQVATFATPVAVTAGTTYVASYFASQGGYAASSGYFSSAGAGTSPVRALSDPAAGGNGVYAYGSTSGFPSSSFNATNYWVDIVMTTTSPVDVTPPSVTGTSPAAGATGVAVTTPVSATFSEPVQPASVMVALKTSGGQAVAGTVSYDAGSMTVTVTPSAPLAVGVDVFGVGVGEGCRGQCDAGCLCVVLHDGGGCAVSVFDLLDRCAGGCGDGGRCGDRGGRPIRG